MENRQVVFVKFFSRSTIRSNHQSLAHLDVVFLVLGLEAEPWLPSHASPSSQKREKRRKAPPSLLNGRPSHRPLLAWTPLTCIIFLYSNYCPRHHATRLAASPLFHITCALALVLFLLARNDLALDTDAASNTCCASDRRPLSERTVPPALSSRL
jgi:hypothetical protein